MKIFRTLILLLTFSLTSVLANAYVYIDELGPVEGTTKCAYAVYSDNGNNEGEFSFIGIILLDCDACDNGMINPGANPGTVIITAERNPDIFRKLYQLGISDATTTAGAKRHPGLPPITREDLAKRYRVVIID